VLTVLILQRGLRVDPRYRAPASGEGDPFAVTQTVTTGPGGQKLVNGRPHGRGAGEADLWPVGHVSKLPDGQVETGPLGPLAFLSTLQRSEVVLWSSRTKKGEDGRPVTVYAQRPTPGAEVLRPGNSPNFRGVRSDRFT